MDRPQFRTAQGFTLLEIIVALMLFSISFALILQGATQSMRNTLRAREYTVASLWAQNQMDQLGVGQDIEAGQSQGSFDDRYQWDMSVEESAVDWQGDSTPLAGNVKLFSVTLVVNWQGRGGQKQLEFKTLRAVQNQGRQ